MDNRYQPAVPQIRKVFRTEGKVLLTEFFLPESYALFRSQLLKFPFQTSQNLISHSYQEAIVPAGFMREILSFVSLVVQRKITCSFTAYRFSWKSYEILHDLKKGTSGLEIIFDFSDPWDPVWGGALVYKDPEGNQLIPPLGNSLLLVQRTGEQRYVQYCNHHSQGKRRLFLRGQIRI